MMNVVGNPAKPAAKPRVSIEASVVRAPIFDVLVEDLFQALLERVRFVLNCLPQPATIAGKLPIGPSPPGGPTMAPDWVPQELVQRLLAASWEHERGAYVVPVEVLALDPLVAVLARNCAGKAVRRLRRRGRRRGPTECRGKAAPRATVARQEPAVDRKITHQSLEPKCHVGE